MMNTMNETHIQDEKDIRMTKETYVWPKRPMRLTKEPDGYDKRTRCTHDSKRKRSIYDKRDLYIDIYLDKRARWI